jgi:hypothetical protein
MTQNGYGVAADSNVKYYASEDLCKAARDAYINQQSIDFGNGKQVYTMNKAVCEAVNIGVNQ